MNYKLLLPLCFYLSWHFTSVSLTPHAVWSVTPPAAGGIHKTTFAPCESSDRDSCLLHSTFYPRALCLTAPFSPSNLQLTLLSLRPLFLFIFHSLPVPFSKVFAVVSHVHSSFILTVNPPPFYSESCWQSSLIVYDSIKSLSTQMGHTVWKTDEPISVNVTVECLSASTSPAALCLFISFFPPSPPPSADDCPLLFLLSPR